MGTWCTQTHLTCFRGRSCFFHYENAIHHSKRLLVWKLPPRSPHLLSTENIWCILKQKSNCNKEDLKLLRHWTLGLEREWTVVGNHWLISGWSSMKREQPFSQPSDHFTVLSTRFQKIKWKLFLVIVVSFCGIQCNIWHLMVMYWAVWSPVWESFDSPWQNNLQTNPADLEKIIVPW